MSYKSSATAEIAHVELGELTQTNDHYTVKVIQGHRLWHQWKVRMRRRINEYD